MEFPVGAGQILPRAESSHKKYGITTGGANSLRDSHLRDQFRPEILVPLERHYDSYRSFPEESGRFVVRRGKGRAKAGQEDVKKSIFKFASELGVKKIALGWRISDRWSVGKHLGPKIKSRKFRQINFFTSSRRNNHHPAAFI